MKKAIISGAILAAMAVAPACAAEAAHNYIGASVGTAVAGQTKIDVTGLGSADFDLDVGLFGSLFGGRDFGNGLSVETEALYFKNDIKSGDIDAFFGVPTDPSSQTVGLLVNVQYTLPLEGQIRPFVGAGGGVGKTKYKLLGESDSSTGFVWQVMGGVSMAVNDQLTWDLRYRYIRSPEIDYSASDGVTTLTAEVKTSAHVIAVGGRLKF